MIDNDPQSEENQRMERDNNRYVGGLKLQAAHEARTRYYVHWFCRTACEIRDKQNNLPVYDNAPDGKDKPLIFHDEDAAQDACDSLNGGI